MGPVLSCSLSSDCRSGGYSSGTHATIGLDEPFGLIELLYLASDESLGGDAGSFAGLQSHACASFGDAAAVANNEVWENRGDSFRSRADDKVL